VAGAPNEADSVIETLKIENCNSGFCGFNLHRRPTPGILHTPVLAWAARRANP